jgi:acetoacetate decarboxylase
VQTTTQTDEFFNRVNNFETVQTSSGPVKVPLLFKNSKLIGAFFSVSIAKARQILPSQKLKPLIIGRGKTILGVAAYEHSETSIGPYNEVAMGIACLFDPRVNIPFLPAIFERSFPIVFYIHHLPVTTKIALDSGIEIWGLPKFLAKIKFEESADKKRCILEADGKQILTLEVQMGDDSNSEIRDLKAFGVKENTLLESTTTTKRLLWTSRKTGCASLELGNHEISDELRSLRLDMKPLRAMFSSSMQGIVQGPIEKEQLQRVNNSAPLMK